MAPFWLDFEKEMMENLMLERDIMFITAKGLAMRTLLTNFLRIHCSATNLVLCLNTMENAELYVETLEAQGVEKQYLPKIITNKFTVQDRKQLYKEGGCFFITSRILVVDLLNQAIDVPMITGIVVAEAHRVTDTSVEAFILRLYREMNRTGFVKAFSEDAYAFASGFHKVEQVMKLLYLRKLLLYPRFHVAIHSCLNQHQPEVYEIEIPLTPLMKDMQAALLVAMELTLNELKRSCKELDETELTMQNALSKALEYMLKKQLSSIWHRLSHKTRQLTGDLTVLRQLLAYLTRYDAITYYSFLMAQKAQNGQQRTPSQWLFTSAADRLFTAAKKRLYKVGKKKDKVEITLEPNSKWKSLDDLLNEINQAKSKLDENLAGGVSTLIMVRDERTSSQLREYLYFNGSDMLEHRFRQYLQQKNSSFSTEHQLLLQAIGLTTTTTATSGKRKSTPAAASDNGPSELASYGLSMEELADLSQADTKKRPKTANLSVILRTNQLVICTYAQGKKCGSLLEDLQPEHVILYDPDVAFIRELEIYHARYYEDPLNVYFMVYEESAEQQAYLTEIKREKEAFEKLIKQKEHMVIPLNVYDIPAHIKAKQTPQYSLDTRTGGRAKVQLISNSIVIDVREFRSALPSMLHKEGMQLHPVTLEVGDYILSSQMCVERKSISDLFGSLNNGRLFNQAEMMTRHYQIPMLLVEFNPDKPFALQEVSEITSDIKHSSITSKLSLLVLHFPQLRILWSKSPQATVDLFKLVKKGHDDPNVETAVAVGSNSGPSNGSTFYNMNSVDVLRKLPGITQHNYRKVMAHCKNLAQLSNMTVDELEPLIGHSSARKLHRFFTHNVNS
ncbi:DNA repair endonuclease XPF [Thraustotheca clavata]|uniref:DNA repair endonuclease XPF n=1 Tax=Thraustotheca clavata TaxID=74557 RepID=A0A1W0A3H2_9STRA|nr:DNA repair endonuclease XPF [Thraustotheca clavata]